MDKGVLRLRFLEKGRDIVIPAWANTAYNPGVEGGANRRVEPCGGGGGETYAARRVREMTYG